MARGVKGSTSTETEKRCYLCERWLPLVAFATSRRCADGLQPSCRECAARYRRANRKRATEASRRHRETDKAKATRATWNEANADQIKIRQSAYYATNKDRWREHVQARRARMASAISEPIDRKIVWERDNGICRLCGSTADPKNWHLEHLTPLARGGSHTYDNVAVSHGTCNREKWLMTLEEWMTRD